MLRPLVQHGLWFVNVGWLFKRKALSRLRRNKVFFVFEDQEVTYQQTWDESVRYAQWFQSVREARIASGQQPAHAPLHIGIYQDNTPEYIYAFFGAALSGAVIFGLNTGFRGPVLANTLRKARLGLVLTEGKYLPELESVLEDTPELDRKDIVRTDTTRPGVAPGEFAPPSVGNFDPLIVIYTSGTTGSPKGVMCPHIKLAGAGLVTSRRIGLKRTDRGYVCMPLFHSNAWFLGIIPMLFVGGSFVLTRRFSASAFEKDLLTHGPTYMNYVGQPIHYILAALEKHHGSGEAVTAALANDPRNKFRIAHGNGATPKDRTKLVRYLGMEHIYELYGSTEATINTVVKPGDPIDSVGALGPRVRILDENDNECPPAVLDDQGRMTNYAEAVGEISARVRRDNIFFHGYHDNPDATDNKYRDGWYRSGDLGHVRMVKRRRYLYFDGRTDDWIRKDGENFSAENVAHYADQHPEVAIAVAYGAPHAVADEAVMIAVQLNEGADFDPQAAFDRFTDQRETGGMDAKWFPDYIRVVETFETTETQKVRVRPLKRRHFTPDDPTDRLYFRTRGDETFRELTDEGYAEIEREFEANGRGELLAR